MINGMDKFLERQHKGYLDREEVLLMRKNFGKLGKYQKTLGEVIKPNFAYVNEHPRRKVTGARESKLNY
jgi:hypothetical protein